MDNKHGKLFVIKQSKGCIFMHKMYQNTFGGWAPPGTAGGECALPRPSRDEGLLMRGRGLLLRGTEGRGRSREETERDDIFRRPPAKVRVSRINTA